MKIWIMRHGQTALNTAGVLQGQMDVPMVDEGREQAARCARLLESEGVRFSAIYSSPLGRAQETARIVAEGTHSQQAPFVTDAHLLEIDYGPFEGRPYREVDRLMGDFIRDPEHCLPPEGVEHIDAVLARAQAFWEELSAAQLRGELPEGNVLVVTHGVTIRALLGVLQGLSRGDVWHTPVDNAELITVELQEGRYGTPVRHRP